MTTTQPAVYQDYHLTIDHRRHEVHSAGMLVHLTPTEWRLLVAFTENPGLALNVARLSRAIYGKQYNDGYAWNQVKWQVGNLRKKMGWEIDGPLVTIRGFGYRYDGE